jgi:hypothetical protein
LSPSSDRNNQRDHSQSRQNPPSSRLQPYIGKRSSKASEGHTPYEKTVDAATESIKDLGESQKDLPSIKTEGMRTFM